MAAIKIIKCPHCGHVLKASKFVSSEGSPIKTCSACGRTYIDTNCYEPALKLYKPSSLGGDVGLSLFAAVLLSFPAFIVSYFVTDANVSKTFIYTGVCAAVLFLMSLFIMIRNRESSDAARKASWEASDKRLQNTQYALLLDSHGFDVPKRYLP